MQKHITRHARQQNSLRVGAFEHQPSFQILRFTPMEKTIPTATDSCHLSSLTSTNITERRNDREKAGRRKSGPFGAHRVWFLRRTENLFCAEGENLRR